MICLDIFNIIFRRKWSSDLVQSFLRFLPGMFCSKSKADVTVRMLKVCTLDFTVLWFLIWGLALYFFALYSGYYHWITCGEDENLFCAKF